MKFEITFDNTNRNDDHILLSLVSFLIELENQSFGRSVECIAVSIAPKNSIEKAQFQEFNFQKESAKIEMSYVSNAITSEEAAYAKSFNSKTFNKICKELRKKFKGLRDILDSKDEFNVDDFLKYVDQKFSMLPLSKDDLWLLRDQWELEHSTDHTELTRTLRESRMDHLEKLWLDTAGQSGDFMPIEDVSWCFGRKVYDDFEEFEKDLNIYCWDIKKRSKSRVGNPEICYTNRFILKFSGVKPGEDSYSELEIEIEGSSKSILTFLEFMFLVNNETYKYLSEAEHVFYEGFDEIEDKKGIPVFELLLGS